VALDRGIDEGLAQRPVRPGEHARDRAERGRGPAGQRDELERRDQPARDGAPQEPWRAAWVGEQGEPVGPADGDGGQERPQPERRDVDPVPHCRVSGVEELEAPVDGEAVDTLAAHPAADGVGRLQHSHVHAGCVHGARTLQARKPGSDDDDVAVHPGSLGLPADARSAAAGLLRRPGDQEVAVLGVPAQPPLDEGADGDDADVPASAHVVEGAPHQRGRDPLALVLRLDRRVDERDPARLPAVPHVPGDVAVHERLVTPARPVVAHLDL
jgi:hypothetical protein